MNLQPVNKETADLLDRVYTNYLLALQAVCAALHLEGEWTYNPHYRALEEVTKPAPEAVPPIEKPGD